MINDNVKIGDGLELKYDENAYQNDDDNNLDDKKDVVNHDDDEDAEDVLQNDEEEQKEEVELEWVKQIKSTTSTWLNLRLKTTVRKIIRVRKRRRKKDMRCE